MQNSPNDDNFIPGIYNYCDRWCERCELTSRCRTFAREQESADDDDLSMESTVRKVSASLAEAKQLLTEKAEELGIDLDAISDEEFAEIQAREKKFVEDDELSGLGDQYWKSAREILDAESLRDRESLEETLTVLYWYLFFIPVRIKCSLHALLDVDGFEDPTQATDPQSYANGTAKTALLAIDRSTIGWRYIADVDDSDRAGSLAELLDTIREKLETRFPLARDFVRPGFDEVEMVM